MGTLKTKTIAKDIYFYILSQKDGSVELHKGLIFQDCITEKCSPQKATFKEFVNSKYGISREASSKEGVHWRNSIWLRERDDKKALLIFFKYFDDLITKKEKELRKIIQRVESIQTNAIRVYFEEK